MIEPLILVSYNVTGYWAYSESIKLLSKLEYKEGRFTLRARLAAGVELNINPELVFEAFKNYAEYRPEDVCVRRTAVYNEKMEKFRWFSENNTCN